MYHFSLCGVDVRRFRKPNKHTRGAIVALDVKICDFRGKLDSSRYRTTSEAALELSQILGEIKFMYLSGLLEAADYRRIVNRLTGQQFDVLDEED
jgi:hypothetical protein